MYYLLYTHNIHTSVQQGKGREKWGHFLTSAAWRSACKVRLLLTVNHGTERGKTQLKR